MNIVKVISTEVNNAMHRVVKVLRLGKADVQTSVEVAPYGVDSNPIKDMIAIYAPTGVKGESVIMGYINKNQQAAPGEQRHFSTDDDGVEQFYTWLKKDGTMEIGGATDTMVRFSALQTAFDQLKSDFDGLVTLYNAHIHITTATVGPTAVPGIIAPTTSVDTPTTADITPAEITEIKTI